MPIPILSPKLRTRAESCHVSQSLVRGSPRKKKTIFVVIDQISLTSYPPYPNLDTKLVDNVTVISNPPSHKKFGQSLSDLFRHITVESHKLLGI